MIIQSQSNEEKISGVVERVTFHNLENGYSVLKVSPFNAPQEIVTVIVHQAKVFAGASVEFFGNWTGHPKFGDQFKATRIIEKKPSSTASMEKYLGSGLIKGVGPKTAKKIVHHFKDKTLNVFEDDIDQLLKVPGIAQKKLAHIQSSWNEHKAIRDVMLFLQNYGISTLFAVKIFKTYKDKSIEIVTDNPYRLAKDIYGIGFLSADRVALKLGLEQDAPRRIEAGIRHVLAGSREQGHCYLLKEQILSEVRELLGIDDEALIEKALYSILENDEIKKRHLFQKESGRHEDCFYSKTLYFDEAYIVKKVKSLSGARIAVDNERIETWIQKYCNLKSISLSDEQNAAVMGSVARSFSILTGGPGCGKTTTTNVLVRLLLAMEKKVLLAAPTGRAAQRMGEVVGMEAKTIHRLLEWTPQKGGFKKGEEEELDGDFIIIDECSMLDVVLAASLLRAIPQKMQVLFIGDPDQLPSVGAGNVLHDLLRSKKVHNFKLTKVFRQAQESFIIKYAHMINRGEVPKIDSPIAATSLWKEGVDCMFFDAEEATQEQLKFIQKVRKVVNEQNETIESADEEELYLGSELKTDSLGRPLREPVISIPKKFQHVDLLKLAQTKDTVDALKEVIKKIHPWSSLNYGLTALDTIRRLFTTTIYQKYGKQIEIQILSPQIRGTLGTRNLNQGMQEACNPPGQGKKELQFGDRIYREGDRIIQTRNNYDLGVFNGDIGNIDQIDFEEGTCLISFGGPSERKEVVYKREDMSELQLAYAITIHKSQGSEFDAVIIPVATQHYKMLFRNLIYTGLTRAKKLAIFVGGRRALTMAVLNIDSRKRQTALTHLMDANLFNSDKQDNRRSPGP